MIAEIGHFALVLSLCVALVQAVVPLMGAARGRASWMAVAGPASGLQLLFIAVAFAAMTNAYVTSDFSLMNVAQNSHTDKPMLYKVAGVWGNHEGSLLLWILILSLFGFAVTLFGRNLPPGLKSRALAVQAMIAVGFLAFILLTSNPFARLEPPPINGNGLNPMLQDPGLAFHPPFLYLGYVGFSMAFSFAIAALLEGRVDAAWARWVRPWTLAAWVFLTCGIILGSWWAYYTLGWGGWWFWDPVENASFMPWLAGTALLHSAVVVEKRDALKSWTILLAIVAFGFSLLGTFLVRSGVLTSVHAFATDPARGVFVLLLLAVAVGGAFTLYAMRAPAMKMGGLFSPISREGSLLLNNVLMATGAATVLLGTLYPLIADALNLGKVSVGPPFFNGVFLPLMVPMVAVMAVGPMMSWKRADLAGVLGRLKVAGALAVGSAMLVWFLQGGSAGPWWTGIGFGLAVWLGLGTLLDLTERLRLFSAPSEAFERAAKLPNSAWGMALAHFGVAVFIIGLTASAAWTTERIQTQKVGETVMVGGFGVTLRKVEDVPGPNYMATRASFEISKDGVVVDVMEPEKRMYRQPPRPTTTAAIRSGFLGDLYVVIGDSDPGKGGWVTRLYFNPCIPWLWAGAGLLVLGGMISLADRRHRIGAPARAAKRVAAKGATA